MYKLEVWVKKNHAWEYQHRDKIMAGDKYYYQYQDLNALPGKAEIVYHRDIKILLLTKGTIDLKITSCD